MNTWLPILFCFLWSDGQPSQEISFDSEIIPVLTKSGCNSGACHGAAAGRGGLRLSLWGNDPDSDYESLVYAFEGRRVNLDDPRKSLILLKGTAEIAHGGDAVLEESGEPYSRLLAWIQSGARRGTAAELLDLTIKPEKFRVPLSTQSTEPLRVIAHFDGKEAIDVTEWATLSINDPSAFSLDSNNHIVGTRSGQHVGVVRFLDRVLPFQIVVPSEPILPNETQAPEARHTELPIHPASQFIDELIERTLRDLRIPISPSISESRWLRRVSLDLTGKLPTWEQITAYHRLPTPFRRQQYVDELLASQSFVDYWTWKLARLLRVRSIPNDPQSLQAYSQWIRDCVQAGVGWDAMTRDLLTATGDSHRVGPASFTRLVPDARAHAELVSEVFAGIQLKCANCHNHPLDRWTQSDYHGFAAIFAGLSRSRQVEWTGRGSVTNLKTKEPAIPRIPGVRDLLTGVDSRNDVVDWLLDPSESLLARAMVNRLWKEMMGRGLVDPVNDLRDTNPATQPELWQMLTQEFIDHNYDIRTTLKNIALSQAYARSDQGVPGNETDDRFYSRGLTRVLAPEIYADAIADVTGVPLLVDGIPIRAISLLDSSTSAEELDQLGRCNSAMCSDDSDSIDSLSTQLYRMNGGFINERLIHPEGRLRQLLAREAKPNEIVNEFFRFALGREPTASEQTRWESEFLLEADDHASQDIPLSLSQSLEDFVWSLLNCREFNEK